MTEQEFNEWIEITVPCALFHIPADAMDDEYNVKLDELIIVRLIAENPGVLKFKSLHWIINHFIKL